MALYLFGSHDWQAKTAQSDALQGGAVLASHKREAVAPVGSSTLAAQLAQALTVSCALVRHLIRLIALPGAIDAGPCRSHSGRRPRLLLPVMSMSTSQARAEDSRRNGGEAAYLRPLSDGKQSAISLRARHTTIGRAADCEVVLDDPRISRQHATITGDGQHYHVRDAGSLNGTFVNGRRVLAATATRLQPATSYALPISGFASSAGQQASRTRL